MALYQPAVHRKAHLPRVVIAWVRHVAEARYTNAENGFEFCKTLCYPVEDGLQLRWIL